MKSICRATVVTAITYALFFVAASTATRAFPAPMEASSYGPIEVHTRDLARGIVTECVSEEPVPVVMPVDGDADQVSVDGAALPAGVVCRTLDNYSGASAEGMLTEYRDGYSLVGMSYSAEIQGLGTKYRIADLADMYVGSGSGARYIAESEVFVDESLEPLRYYIEFIRRQQGDVAAIPSTIFMVQRQVEGAVLIFILDYRDVQ